MTRRFTGFVACLLLGLVGCSTFEKRAPATTGPTLWKGLGSHHRPVTTRSTAAQRYFDQGLIWAFSFNHDEAIRSFGEAVRLDPECAMAWWGIALCNGPHINNPVMDEAHSRAAWTAIQKAIALQDRVSPTERALIQALAKRYADPPPSDHRPLNEAYASAMKEVQRANPGDVDIAVLAAESLMDLQPWDLWEKDGRPKGNTTEIVALLESAMRADPKHPGASHLYIHAVEASSQPGRAVAAADRLRSLVPASGHMTHMPSHIDVRVGNWSAASRQNEQAIVADTKYRAISPRQGFYNVYMAHNHHFLAFASMMQGRSQTALQAARNMLAGVPAEFADKQPALVDPFMSIVIEVLMRFGRWDEALAEPAPPERFPISTAMWHFARGVAFASKNRIGDALNEQSAFREAVAKVPENAIMAINSARKTLSIAEYMLAGEIAYRQGKTDEAVVDLKKGVAIEDDLLYMEPPDWVQPVRHTLGAVLVSAGRYHEAEQVYREDLKRWPENGWSLYGLAECLEKRGDEQEAKEVRSRFRKVWSQADVTIGSSCLCVPATK